MSETMHCHLYHRRRGRGHGGILKKPVNRVFLVLSDMLISKIDVRALDFTGEVVFRAPFSL